MNNNNSKKSNNVLTQFGKDVATVMVGTFVSYALVQFISLSILEQRAYLSFDNKLLFHLFSYQMIPGLVAFTILIGAVYYLFRKAKKSMMLLNEKELHIEHEKAVINTSQKITSMMVNYIARYNGEIKEWIESKRENGQQPPQKVEQANEKIGMALQAMSELSYVMPYIDSGKNDLESFAEKLEQRLNQTSMKQIPVIESA